MATSTTNVSRSCNRTNQREALCAGSGNGCHRGDDRRHLPAVQLPDACNGAGGIALIGRRFHADADRLRAGGPTPTPAAGTPGASASPSASTTAGYKDGSYTGQDAPNQYGDVQVKVIISGGKITDVQALTLPSDRQRSAEISQQAGPLLHDEVVQAQSAQIDILSGATFTGDSYAQSVQSALDQAHS